MKPYALMALIAGFSHFSSFSQLFNFQETYYDYWWRETPTIIDARFYSSEKKTDSGWYRTDYYLFYNGRKPQMTGLYEDKEDLIRNGTFRWYYPYAGLKTIGSYIHNKKEGTWYNYFQDGTIKDSLNYKNGHPIDISISWFENGYQKDSLNMNDNGKGTYVSWFDNGVPCEAGRYSEFNKKNGKWQYFDKDGAIAEEEVYKDGILQSRKSFNKDGGFSEDTTSHDKDAFFPGGAKAWRKYLNQNLKFPSLRELGNYPSIVVLVSGMVDEEGNVSDVEVEVPFHPDFDKVTFEVLKKSPKWEPAVIHNRKMRSRVQQAVQYSAFVGG